MKDVRGVRTFVGIDGHYEDCAVHAVSRQGRIVLVRNNVPTTVRSLRRTLRGLPGPVWVMLECSTMAFFVKQSIEAIVDRVIVCETRENHWIAKSEVKEDPLDAARLARLLRMGEFEEVHIPARARLEFRELVQAYQKVVGDVTRCKNRIMDKYRRYGIRKLNGSVYEKEYRDEWLKKLRRPCIRQIVSIRYAMLDASLSAQTTLARSMGRMLRPTREYKILLSMPGVGPIVAAIFIAVIDTPYRFATKQKLWKYAGLSISSRSSGKSKAKEGGARTGNRLLKYAAMMAAKHAIRAENRFARHYHDMIGQGISPAMSLKTIARSILASAWSMWKNGSMYRDDIQAHAA